MSIHLYFVDESWCFLNVKPNNTYWIDWLTIFDEQLLCIKENKYHFYDINNKIFMI